ncbi:DNA adenine methylase [Centipeda periodontii DSM 2778]|uniref:Site-specific DNA-methyltransferase (adenine-specific) n=2 Tax=Centipeda TaxID=82202 RepID=F5RJN0_9FIRM|nr:DNA adenine methylase [Centipeda periodontii DSM 2778]
MTVSANMDRTEAYKAKPILKWAGGKTQLLGELCAKVPPRYGKYIEPFFGGGALFFALAPERAVLADSNPELINMYRAVAADAEQVIAHLEQYENTSEHFYEVRALDWEQLSPVEAAARTIFLNKTCFNGLYRVNQKGQFNVPFGRYKNPKICDRAAILAATRVLSRAEIICGDYLDVLETHAAAGDLIFLDPPYLPISAYADFKRYTKERFYEEDHVRLAEMVARLHERGCYVILTNSNHPLVHELYARYPIEIIQTKRHISSNGKSRRGEDVIVTAAPVARPRIARVEVPLSARVAQYPPTRFMGSKQKLLHEVWAVASQFGAETITDLFSGSGIVSYMFKAQGKTVLSNDYMAMSATFSKAMVENNTVTLSSCTAEELLLAQKESDHFVARTFQGLYYTDEENDLIDTLRTNIAHLRNPYERAIAMTALIRACIKKRPRGIFTYTGHRYDDGRKDLQKTLEEQFLEAVELVNAAVFDNGRASRARWGDAMTVRIPSDLVYMDPPYYSPLSDNEYVRRYHFVEGLARNWEGVEIQEHTLTKKFKSYPTPFSTRLGAAEAFDRLFRKFAKSVLVVSYSSNSLPTQEEMLALMAKYKEHVEVIPVDYKYSFGNQATAKTHRNAVQEYLFVGY